MSEFVGQPISRVDGVAKVTGKARYSADWDVPGLLHGVIFQSEIPSGRIGAFNLWQARHVPGVVDIMTFENAPRVKFPGADGTGESFAPLQSDKIFYNGQAIGVVLAKTLEAANEAAKLVKVHYVRGPARLDITKHMDEAYPIDKMPPIGPIGEVRGNVQKGMSEAKVKTDATYTIPAENHNPLEPSATIALWKNGRLEAYDSSQGVWRISELLGKAFHAAQNEVHVITKFVGGGFGCKGSLWGNQLLAAMAAKKVSQPVKLVVTREQMFTTVGHRAYTVQKVRLGADTDGRLTAIEHLTTNHTAVNKDYSERSSVPTASLYRCDNVRAVHRLVTLNYQVPTFMRAPGFSSGSFALESSLDELAEQLKLDPIELRLRNYAMVDGKEGEPFSSKSLSECYRVGAEKFDWARRKMQPRARREGDYFVGYGMATAVYPAHRFPATANVELRSDGTARVRSATQDIGTGTYTIMTQLAADGLGIDLNKVDFDLGDSRFPPAGVSGGSTTAASVGTAIHFACKKIRQELFGLAQAFTDSPFTGAKFEDAMFSNGKITLKSDPARSQTYAELFNRSGKDSLTAQGENPKEQGAEGPSKFSFGAQFSEVRVHAYTGEVRLVNHVGAFASGKILNEKTARSQYQGGIIFGMGQALMEATIPDIRSGRLVVKDLADYHVPTHADVPPIEIVMVKETDNEVNPIGAKGIGEIGIVGVAAAIANAVYNATGVRIRDLPITPDKLVPEYRAQTMIGAR